MKYVIKADGSKQPFRKRKVFKTCLRMGAPRKVAKRIADEVEKRVYDGMKTKEILDLVHSMLKEHNPAFGFRTDLRTALSLLRPKPDFEQFVRLVLKDLGYEVLPNQVIRGKCVEHELDGLVKDNEKTYMLEIKHHVNPHTFSGMDVCLEAYSTFLDINEGYKVGNSTIRLDGIIVACNTKFSDHAKRYANCMGIKLYSWDMPEERSLERIIEERKLYPITLIKQLDRRILEKFGDNGIVLLKQLTSNSAKEISSATGVRVKRVEEIQSIARKLMGEE